MTRSVRQIVLAILFSLIMINSMMGSFAGGALATTSGHTQTTAPAAVQPGEPVATHDVETVNITDELAVWERAPLRPAVVDRSNAVTTVNSQTVFLETQSELAEIQTPQEGVFQQGAQVSFELAPQTAADTAQFSGDEFKVLVTRIDAERDTTEVFLDAQNVTVEEVERALEDVDGFDDFNQTVQDQNEVRFGTIRDFFEGTEEFEQFADSFEANQTLTTERFEQALTSEEFLNLTEFSTAPGDEIDSTGNADATINLDEAGTYLLIGHVGGEVYEADDDRPFFNGTTVLSVDAVTAQESASTIDVATTDGEVEAGENVSVDATANLDADDNVSHAVVVMDEDTFSQSQSRIIVDDEFSRDLRAESVTVNSTIAEIQGVANVAPNVRISGTDIASDRFSGTVSTEDQANSFFDIRDALVDGFDIRDQAGDAATFNAVGDTTLNASMTAIGNVSDEETIEVETLDEWETGEYTVLHIASDQQDGTISTNRSTIDIVDSIDTGGDGGDDEDDEDDEADEDEEADDIEPPVDVDPPELPAGVNVSVNETVNIEVDPETNRSTATFGENNTVASVAFDFEVNGSVNARTLDSEPNETGPAPGASVAVTQITVGDELENSSATIQMRVSNERLDEIGADAEDLRINRFADGEWQGLETTVVNETDAHVLIEAQTPGFSYFAVSAVSEPEAVASVTPETVESGEEVELSGAESTNQYGDIVAYDWNVAGETLTGETVATTIDEAGTIEAELTVTNDAGETDTATVSFTVEEPTGDRTDDGTGDGTGDGTDDGTGDGTDDGTGDGTGDGTDDGPTEEPGGFPVFGLILVAFVLAAVAIIALYARQEE